jgi:hypothetical protein
MADVVTTIETKLQTAISNAIAATTGRCVIGFKETEKLLTRPWARFEIGSGEPVVVDANKYMQETLTAFVEIIGDTREQVRAAITTLRALFEPLPTDWTGVLLVDIVPGTIEYPAGSVSATEKYIGAIEFLITIRVEYA